MDNNVNLCDVCKTPLVSAKDKISLSGELRMDGSWNFNNMVCPNCHPDLVETEKH